MRKTLLSSALLLASLSAIAEEKSTQADSQSLEELQKRVEQLEQELQQRLEAIADTVEQRTASDSKNSRFSIGGYGEMHYNNLDENGEDVRELDLHRLVFFVGYEFSDRIRFVSELEIEHAISSASANGEVEVEQAYLEFDLNDHMTTQAGLLLMPLGIINEVHEPPTFYGVERPVIETTVIPTTWWAGGVKFNHRFDNGFSYDLMISEGLKTEDPNSSPSAEPFNIKNGKQKTSLADAFDLAYTGRVSYTGVPGLEVAAYAQYQPDLDQSAEESYADDATLIGGHVIYQWQSLTAKALYAQWDLAGDEAAAAGKDLQAGGYVELNYKANEQWGFFVRQSEWTLEEDVDASQTDFGVNFYPHEDVVIKADYQLQNDDAGNSDGFNLGLGYQF